MEHQYVDTHYEALIQSVTSVMPITDKLYESGNLTWEVYSKITKATSKNSQKRELFSAVKSGGPALKSAFYKVLQEIKPDVIQELEDAQFVDCHRHKLIQRITAVMPIADSMKALKILNEETYSMIFVAYTNMDRMRRLLSALSTNRAKYAFYNLLELNEPFLVEDLKREGNAQTSSKVLETESHPQNAEKVQTEAIQQRTEDQRITRWNRNRSCTRHSTKIEELLREPDRKKVGNLCFYKDEKYMIGSGGSGTQVYIGVTEDGIEVAVKLITRNPRNTKDFKNELSHLQDSKLESPYIVRYVTCAEDNDFYYLANRLCEYDLVDYMEYLRQPEQNDRKETTLRRIVEEMLLGLQVLHHAGLVHRDIKPKNVLIDKEERARLADFGISRKLEEGKTRVYTERAGTQGWEATEILEQFEKRNTTLKVDYNQRSDIQVAGMLTYYILSDGKHPFGEGIRCELNILEGEYSLGDIQNIAAKDLIEWMINKNKDERPSVDKVLNHPYFWNDKRIREVLHNLGNKEEIQEYKNVENNEELYDTVKKYTAGKTFSDWKTKAPKTWTKIGKYLPNDLLGLLRHLRNALGHQEKEFYKRKMIDEFPDFLISLHRLAMDMGWEY